MADDTFHLFPRLPAELRRQIWGYCLPHRVSEIDDPIGYQVYGMLEPEAIPCLLYPTKVSNGYPPVLTRVCHESRSMALESGFWVSELERRDRKLPWDASTAEWGSENTIDRGYWQDTARHSAHINWEPSYVVLYGCSVSDQTLADLAVEAKKLNGKASFMLEFMTEYDGHLRDDPQTEPIGEWLMTISPRRKEELKALKLLPEWLVVVRVVVVHLDFARAAKTGLFGLLGDEHVQVLDAASPLVEQLYDLAESCERAASAITEPQDFERMDVEEMEALVKREAIKAFHNDEAGERLRPAIMFRLCTRMCNHIVTPGQQPGVSVG